MFGMGFGEMMIILVIVLLVFGAGKLPQLGDSLGKSIRNFKKAAQGDEPHEDKDTRDAIEVSKKTEQQLSAGSTKRRVIQEEVDDPTLGDDEEEVVIVRRKKRAPEGETSKKD